MKNIIILVIGMIFLGGCAKVQSSVGVIQESKTKFYKPYATVYNNVKSTLMALEWQITHADKDEGLVQAKTPVNLLTWGDLVTIHIIETKKDEITVNATSTTSQQIDWGKGRKNIEAFYKHLHNALK